MEKSIPTNLMVMTTFPSMTGDYNISFFDGAHGAAGPMLKIEILAVELWLSFCPAT